MIRVEKVNKQFGGQIILEKSDLVGIYSQKGEIVALAESLLSENEIKEQTKGYAFQTKRIIMKPKTYPKNWRTSPTQKE